MSDVKRDIHIHIQKTYPSQVCVTSACEQLPDPPLLPISTEELKIHRKIILQFVFGHISLKKANGILNH